MISKKTEKINEIQLYICYLFYIFFTVNYNIFSCNLFVLYISFIDTLIKKFDYYRDEKDQKLH